MQVVFGLYGREKVYYEVLNFDQFDGEMVVFFDWFENVVVIDLVLKVVIVYFWFVIIYLFDDGNGCIVCVIVDMVLVWFENSL